jgi:hypothetical protein
MKPARESLLSSSVMRALAVMAVSGESKIIFLWDKGLKGFLIIR